MWGKENRNEPMFMNPVIFIGASVLLGLLFALQEWFTLRRMGSHARAGIFFESWGIHFLLWGILCWLLWRFLRKQVQSAGLVSILAAFLPLSIVVSVVEEMVWVYLFPGLPLNHPNLSYWQRLTLYLDMELFDNIVIFWCAFMLFRGIGYYQRYRENERTATQLQIQLANAQISALRMQLNPHFLFNTMNSISSLMRSDIDGADAMLEQLSCLMRITLERGDAQLITLRDEMEFIETYLALQGRRYAGRVEQTVSVDPELYDALVPSMLLQPIVENAYMHGLSKIPANGELLIEVKKDGKQMMICVVNSGVGLNASKPKRSDRNGVGLTNIKSRLRLHYGDDASLSIDEIDRRRVLVTIRFPLQFSMRLVTPIAGYGTQ
jgi:two-component system, LytTR family, sensor kinase